MKDKKRKKFNTATIKHENERKKSEEQRGIMKGRGEGVRPVRLHPAVNNKSKSRGWR